MSYWIKNLEYAFTTLVDQVKKVLALYLFLIFLNM